MISGAPLASSSSVAGTAPSTEFSSGTSAPSASPARTASIASVTLAIGSGVASTPPGSRRSAAWANVPSGPRKASVVTPKAYGRTLTRLAAEQPGALLVHRGLDGLPLLGRQVVLALAADDPLRVHPGVGTASNGTEDHTVSGRVEQSERERHAAGQVRERVVPDECDAAQ